MTTKHPWIDEGGELVAGIYRNMRDADYQALDAMRFSTLKAGLVSARALRHAIDVPRADSTAFREGRGVHVAVLQPQHADDELITAPDEHVTNSGALSGRKATLEWLSGIGRDATVLTARERLRVDGMAAAVASHNGATELLAECPDREVTAIWYEQLGDGSRIACKARADAAGEGMLADLKTWRPRGAFSADNFGREVHRFQYHAQLGWYERGFRRAALQAGIDDPLANAFEAWGWVVVDKRPPFDVLALDADGNMMEVGREMAREAFDVYEAALLSGEWPGINSGRCDVSLPPWAFDALDSADDLDVEGFDND